MKMELEKAMLSVKELGIKPVCIEAGHIYVDQEVGWEQKIGVEIGVKVSKTLFELGWPTWNMVFIDDLNVKAKTLNENEYLGFLKEAGFEPQVVAFESELIADGEALIELLKEKALVKKRKKDGKVFLAKEQIAIQEADWKGNIPTCEVLDAVLYLKKFKQAGVCVTVLPSFYPDEQKKTKKILEILGAKKTILNVYFNKNGEFWTDFDF